MPKLKRIKPPEDLASRYRLNQRGKRLLEQISGNLPNEPKEEIAKYLAQDETNTYSPR